MMITPPARSVPARSPADADAAALTLVLSHADVAALRRQLAALIAPEPYGEGDDTPGPALQAGLPKAAPGRAVRRR